MKLVNNSIWMILTLIMNQSVSAVIGIEKWAVLQYQIELRKMMQNFKAENFNALGMKADQAEASMELSKEPLKPDEVKSIAEDVRSARSLLAKYQKEAAQDTSSRTLLTKPKIETSKKEK